ncbi:MAG: hypothetical protein ACM3N4_00765 [Nitrososphaerota archaeon]
MKNHKARTLLFSGFTIVAAVMVATSVFFLRAAPTARAASGNQTVQNLTETGTSVFVSGPTGLTGDTLHQALPQNTDRDQHTNAVHDNAPTTNPNPNGASVTSHNRGFAGFQGLNHFDQRTRDGGNAYSLEPPDQGLCVGNGKVLEAVNDVMVVFDKSGNRLTAPESLNTFFGLPYAINRTTGVAGPFLSDPKCYYDTGTNRFFLTVLELDAAPSVRAHTLIAVSQTSDPTGTWTDFSIDATDDGLNGTPSNPNCPCFGDQPLIGADAYGFYISTNEFPSFVAGFNGAQVYAISKWGLASAASHGSSTLPPVVHINVGTIPTPDTGGIWYSLQPATTPTALLTLSNGGTEYFMSALQFGPAPLDNRIAVWALTNTSSLNRRSPNVSLLHTVIGSETYGLRADGSLTATQKAGSIPLGEFVGNPEAQLNANDDRMNQVVYAAGLLYSGVNTVVGDGSRVGIAYFIVHPYVTRSHGSLAVHATMARQGYVSATNNNVFFPSIGVNKYGQGVMTFTLSGPDYYPTSAYATVNAFFGAGPIHIAGEGVGPSDGFTGYPALVGGNGVARWGDYSAAVADSDGSIWFASEYIAQTCTLAQWTADSTCDSTRTQLANWSTFVGHVSAWATGQH